MTSIRILLSLLVLGATAQPLMAQSTYSTVCPPYPVTANRISTVNPQNYNLSKVRTWLKHPVPSPTASVPNPTSLNTDLVFVIAHRGDWEFCPENTLESYEAAVDQGIDGIEMDIRISGPGLDPSTNVYYPNGEVFLSHDFDLRGEAPDPYGTTNIIYTASPDQLVGRAMVDRYGNAAKDSSGNQITFHTLNDLLTNIMTRARLTPGAISAGAGNGGADLIVRGTLFLFDPKANSPKDPLTNITYPNSDQYSAVAEAMREVQAFEVTNHIDMTLMMTYTLNPNEITAAQWSSLINTYYGSSVNQPTFMPYTYAPATVPSTVPANIAAFRVLPTYLMTSWFVKYNGATTQQFAVNDLAAGAGTDGFISASNWPEGYRNSDGLCLDYTVSSTVTLGGCGSQPFNINNQSAYDFMYQPAGSPFPRVQSTMIQADMFKEVNNYLTVIGLRNLSRIE